MLAGGQPARHQFVETRSNLDAVTVHGSARASVVTRSVPGVRRHQQSPRRTIPAIAAVVPTSGSRPSARSCAVRMSDSSRSSASTIPRVKSGSMACEADHRRGGLGTARPSLNPVQRGVGRRARNTRRRMCRSRTPRPSRLQPHIQPARRPRRVAEPAPPAQRSGRCRSLDHRARPCPPTPG